MIVDIGADTTEISVLSLGGIVISRLLTIGGNTLDESICAHVKKYYNLLIGKKTAEALKNKLASAFPKNESFAHVYGRDVVTGLPVNKRISSILIYKAICDYLNTLIDTMRVILERTPPEISSDIIDSGIYITGGCAPIKHLGDLISKETELDVNICEDSNNTVIKGLGKIIEDSTYRVLPTIVKSHGR
jgi:rod shape-determining protein MreB